MAPCVGLVGATDYAQAVRRAEWFLDGKSRELTDELTAAMEQASAALQFEDAARLRDLIAGIRQVQAVQFVDRDLADLDALAVALRDGVACVVLLAFRDGRNLGTRTWFPDANGSDDAAEVLAAFVGQHYAGQRPPREIVLDRDIPERELLESALSEVAGHRVRLKDTVRGERAGLRELVQRNAALALAQHLASRDNREARRADLARLLELDAAPTRIECFDISHTQGEATVASCVVFDANGPASAHYRRFNITGITPGDDYAAMRQALERRFRRVASEDTAEREQAIATLPDLLLIDGGAGQLRAASEVLGTLGIQAITVVGVAKGPARKPGEETLLLPDGRQLRPGVASPGLQLVQQVRDEAHRFAITGHRGRRQKARTHSRLEDIPGIGPRRRAALLRHFGGLAGLKAAGREEIARVDGINAALATRIYATLHGSDPDATSPA
jgi:excinuclease ABC subunit C